MDALEKKLDPVEGELYQVKLKSSEGNLGLPNELNEEYDSFSFDIQNADNAPTQGQQEVYQDLHQRLEQQLAAWKQIAQTDVPALNAEIQKAGIPAVSLRSTASGE
jgi:hypothetical protein